MDGPVPLGSRYLLDNIIGYGAAGHVWRGRRRKDGQPLAIKVLRREFTSDQDAVGRFLRERTALLSVSHSNLVPIHDLVVEGETLAIVMELVDGDNLRVTQARMAFEPGQAATLLSQIADALAVVHRAGIVHRDVKPENVLVTWRGGHPWARLTDFGVARMPDGQAITKQSQFVGTIEYLAPEIATGRPAGSSADVYALGVTAYELLAGRRPFAADNALALIRAHLEDEPERPPTAGDAMWDLVRACLAKRPGDRPPAHALAEGFAAVTGRAAPLPAGAPPPLPAPMSVSPMPAAPPALNEPEILLTAGPTTPIPDAPPKPPRPKRRWLGPALGVLALLTGATAIGFWFGRPEPTVPAPPPATPYQPYYLPVTATSPKVGTIQLDFTDVSQLPGFKMYVVYRGNRKLDELRNGQTSPYLIPGVDHKSRYCYRVWALIETDKPVPPAPKPACRVADGRPATQK
ncbi:protein kinase domain-containing protein [Streptosporangium sp. DT93]|uniref:serine/threonine-protein kinase n=1 Tax=Streptosporangium sp. DT93 TaxID=3393428 RepID=UPI003CF422C3